MRTAIFTWIAIFSTMYCYSQEFAGKYYHTDEIAGRKCGMSINFAQDSSFKYEYRCDLMKDEAIGTAVIVGNIITLSYFTTDNHIVSFKDTIDSGIASVPYLTKQPVTFEQKVPTLGANLRPFVLKQKRNKLIVLKYINAEVNYINLKKIVYKKSKKE